MHVINLDGNGFLLDLRRNGHDAPIKDPDKAQLYLEQTLLAGIKASGKTKVMLFVHGGLNGQKQGMQHFADDYDDINAGENYPVFVVWPSGLKSTYLEHVLWVRQGIKAESTGAKVFTVATSPFVVLADFGRAIVRLPLVIANNSKTDLETITAVRHLSGGAAVRQYQDIVREGYNVRIEDDYSLTSHRAVRGITYWLTLPVKYFAASLIDGLGKGAWDDMLRRTQQVYPARSDGAAYSQVQTDMAKQQRMQPPQQLLLPGLAMVQRYLSEAQEKRGQRYKAAGLPTFIGSLSSLQKANPNLKVTLVGHSMGAIILNRVVRDSDMEFSNIVYLGAACTIEDFARSALL